MSERQGPTLFGEIRRMARTSGAVGGIAARVAGQRFLGLRTDKAAHAEDLKAVAEAYPDLSLGSYPFQNPTGWGTNLVVRGLDAARVAEALTSALAAEAGHAEPLSSARSAF